MENNPSFEEEHTGLEDVLIEIKIYNRVMRQKKKMKKKKKVIFIEKIVDSNICI